TDVLRQPGAVLGKLWDYAGKTRGIAEGAGMTSARTGDAPAVRIEAENEWAWCGERRLLLMPKAFAVLRQLVDHAGRLITKADLLESVWSGTVVSEAALTSCIRDLRKAL